MTRNVLLGGIVVLAMMTGVLGYWVYDRQNSSGVDISIGGTGFSVRER